MSYWGRRQQIKYISTIILIAIILAAYPVYRIFFDHPPTCFDGKQDQNETGIDCGGVCQKICPTESLNPIVLYTRILQTVPGKYNVVASIENPNSKLLAENVPYSFKVYDSENALMAEQDGTTFIPPNMIFPIFDGPVDTGNRTPAKILFEFDNYPVWARASTTAPALNILNENLSGTTTLPRLDATIQNPTPYDLNDQIEVVALIYDNNSNLIGASKTLVNFLLKGGSVPLVFTWSAPFGATVGKIDIIPNIPLDDFIPVAPK